MTDLARQAAGLISVSSGSRGRIRQRDVLAILGDLGTLVSHEDAALLREFKRVTPGVDAGLEHRIHADSDDVWCANVINRKDHGVLKTAFAATPQAALKSALDAAGVPDAARMGEKA